MPPNRYRISKKILFVLWVEKIIHCYACRNVLKGRDGVFFIVLPKNSLIINWIEIPKQIHITKGLMIFAPCLMASFAPRVAPIACPTHITIPKSHKTFPLRIKNTIEAILILKTIEREWARALLSPYPPMLTSIVRQASQSQPLKIHHKNSPKHRGYEITLY